MEKQGTRKGDQGDQPVGEAVTHPLRKNHEQGLFSSASIHIPTV